MEVHYFSADMAADAANRAEDERFLNDPAGVLGAPAISALERVRDMLGLDYAGIDFAIDRAGNVVVFEAKRDDDRVAAAAGCRWDYRREPTARVIEAVRKMLLPVQ